MRRRRRLRQLSLNELSDASAERPVVFGVGNHGHDEVVWINQTAFTEFGGEGAIRTLFAFGRPPLLEDLNDGDIRGALKTETGVFDDDVARTMLADELVPVPFGRVETREHDVVDGVGEGT